MVFEVIGDSSKNIFRENIFIKNISSKNTVKQLLEHVQQ